MEIYQYYGEDIQLTYQAQIQLVDGQEESEQRILRRLLTNPGTYAFEPTYGAGLAQYVGLNFTEAVQNQLKGVIMTQMLQEPTVSQSTAPTVSLSQNNNQINVEINYTYAPTNTVFTLSFNVSA